MNGGIQLTDAILHRDQAGNQLFLDFLLKCCKSCLVSRQTLFILGFTVCQLLLCIQQLLLSFLNFSVEFFFAVFILDPAVIQLSSGIFQLFPGVLQLFFGIRQLLLAIGQLLFGIRQLYTGIFQLLLAFLVVGQSILVFLFAIFQLFSGIGKLLLSICHLSL